MLADRCVGVGKDHTLVGQLFLNRAVNHFRFKLSFHSGQVLTLRLRNPQFFKRVFDLGRNVVPRFPLVGGGFQVVIDILKVQINVATPFRHRL